MQPGPGGASERTFIETARRAQIVAAAIDTIAELGYARASLARIAERIGISRGLISYHFAGKDELIKEIGLEVRERARAYMVPRIVAHSTGPEQLRAYIESNLAFIREHRNLLMAIMEIARNAVTADRKRLADGYSVDEAVRALGQLLSGFQKAGEFRADFDPRAMAIAIRAAIDAAPPRLAFDPQFDIDNYASQLVTVFDLATRVEGGP